MVVRTYCHLWNKNKDIEQPLTRWVQSQNSDIYCIVIIIVVILLLYVLYYVNNYFNSITWSSTNLEKTYFEKTLGKTCFLLKNPVFIVFFLNSIFLANPANHHMDKDALCNKKAKHATRSHSSKLNIIFSNRFVIFHADLLFDAQLFLWHCRRFGRSVFQFLIFTPFKCIMLLWREWICTNFTIVFDDKLMWPKVDVT